MDNLYDRDFNLWVERTAIAIRNKDIKSMDWDNLLEEIEDMGASQKRALRSYTQRLIEHILKLNYWESESDRCSSGWRIEIANFREQIANILEDSPSLKNYLAENYSTWFERSRNLLKATETFDLSKSQIISLEQILKDDFFVIK